MPSRPAGGTLSESPALTKTASGSTMHLLPIQPHRIATDKERLSIQFPWDDTGDGNTGGGSLLNNWALESGDNLVFDSGDNAIFEAQ